MKRRALVVFLVALFGVVLLPTLAMARRSGGSFGGRSGFRSSPSAYRGGYSNRPSGYGRSGPNVIVMPGFGWGLGGYGMGGGGGFGLMGTVLMLGVVGLGAMMVIRAARHARNMPRQVDWDDEHDAPVIEPVYIYKMQLGLGRSARAIQNRLAQFAAEGDTSSQAGLAHLLQQTGLELMREKHSIRYNAVEASGPMSPTNGETKMNAATLAERSRFQVERVRGADGKVRRSEAAQVEGDEALEYIVVTLVLATRRKLSDLKQITSHEELDGVLATLGGVSPDALLGLEVIWTPADPGDSMTEADLLTTYPAMRSV